MIACTPRAFLRALMVSLLIPASVPARPGATQRAVQSLSAVSYTMKDGLPSNQINVIVQDSRGFLWIGTNNGLSMYDGSGFANYSVPQGLTNTWITDIGESRAEPGTLWIGTIAGGVCRFSNGRFTAMSNAGSVNVLNEDRQGNLWYVLNDTLYVRRGEKAEVVARSRPSARGDICELPDGEIAVGLDRSVSFYTPEGGLARSLELPLEPADQVYSMTVGGEGRLWVTTNGNCVLLVQDGAVMRRRCFGDAKPFFAGEDAGGTLWVRTSTGLMEFQQGLEEGPKSYTVEDALPETWAGPMTFDREGNMWVGTWAKGLMKVPDRRLLHIDVRALTDATADAEGHIWFATDDGMAEIFRGGSGAWSLYSHPRSEVPAVPTPDSYGRLWFAAGGSPVTLSCFDRALSPAGGSRLRLTYRVPLRTRGVWTSFVDRQDRLWISLAEGDIKVFDLRSKEFVRYDDLERGLPHERVGAFYQDREGNIWIGFWSQGLGYLPAAGQSPRLFTEADGLPNNSIRSICEDNDKRLWVGTRHGGVGAFTDGRFQSITVKEGLESNSIWQIAGDAQGRLWLRTDVGLECIDRASLRVVPAGLEFRGERLRSFGVFRDQYLWTLSGDALWVFDLSRPEERGEPPLVYVKSFSVNDSPREILDGQHFSFGEDNCVVEFVSPSFRDERSVRFRYRLLGADTTWSAPTRQRSVAYASLRPGSYTFEVLASTTHGGVSPRAATLSFVIQPPFWQTWWFLAGVLLVLTGTIAGSVRYFSVQTWRRRVRELELEQALVEERRRTRERIAGDLHDDVASTLSSIAFFTESLRQRIGDSLEIRSLLQKISTLALEAEDAVGDIVWSVSPQHDSLQELCVRMRDVGSDLCTPHGIDFHARFDQPEQDRVLDDAVRKNLYLVFKEGIQNVIKHSRARSVELAVRVQDGTLHFSLSDDGTGFTPPGEAMRKDRGHGLRNMVRRAGSVGASFVIDSSPGRGTVLTLTVPMT